MPWAESVGALADLLDAGKIQMAGVSNATVAQIDEAQEVLGGRLVSVQNEFSPRFRSSESELEHCEKIGVAFIPWSPLGGIGRTGAHRARLPGLRRGGRRRSGATPAAGDPGLDAGQGHPGHPDPGQQPARPPPSASAAAADISLTPEQVARPRRGSLSRTLAEQNAAATALDDRCRVATRLRRRRSPCLQ